MFFVVPASSSRASLAACRRQTGRARSCSWRSASLPSASLYDLPFDASTSEKLAGLSSLPPGALPQEPLGSRTPPEAVVSIPEPVGGRTPPGQFPGEAGRDSGSSPSGLPVPAELLWLAAGLPMFVCRFMAGLVSCINERQTGSPGGAFGCVQPLQRQTRKNLTASCLQM